MPVEDCVIIENKWSPWDRIPRFSGASSVDAQVAVQSASRKIKQRLGLRGEPFQFRGTGSGTEVQAVGVSGTLSLKEISIEVVPKFVLQRERLSAWNTSTLFLLESLAGKHVISLLADRQTWKGHSITDLIAHAFADAVERAAREQPIHVYRHFEESAPVLRGRMNISRQLSRIHQAPHVIECDVDQLDPNNMYNDVLKWAAFELARLARDKDLRQRLESLKLSLPGDPERAFAFKHLRLVPPPQFQIWTDALELAHLLASGMALSTLGGRRSGYSLMFNMERAFERFVEVSLARSLVTAGNQDAASRQEWSKYALPNFKGGRPLYCRPDNIIRRHGNPVVIVDAKYKLLDEELWLPNVEQTGVAPLGTDIYELLTGMIANRCKLGLLVYPCSSTEPNVPPRFRTWTINVYGINVRVGALPVPLLGLNSRSALSKAQFELTKDIEEFEKSAA